MARRVAEITRFGMWGMIIAMVLCSAVVAPAAEPKADRQFIAVVADSHGLETELKNVFFYWEEKVSETSFVPHELRHFPAKRGTSTVNIKFETIKQVDVKSSDGKSEPVLTITLTNGKTGEFVPAVNGSLRGESDFGQVDVPIPSISKVTFK
jgi:hypothetical protein